MRTKPRTRPNDTLPHYERHYSSLSAAITDTDDMQTAQNQWYRGYMEERQENDIDFFGGHTWSGAQRYKHGNAELAQKALAAIAATPTAAQTARITREYNDTDGEDMDMERYHDGEERCLIRRKKILSTAGKGPIKIVVNLSEDRRITTGQMLYKCYAATKLCSHYERTGRRCEIIAAMAVDHKEYTAYTTITIKRASQPLDISAVAWATSPAFFRLWGFRLLLKNYPCSRDTFGAPTKLPPQAPGTIAIDETQCLSQCEAEEFIAKIGKNTRN
jgi:hypothetical protein